MPPGAHQHHKWLSQKRTKDHIKDWEAVAWTPTLRIVHDNNPPLRLFTSRKDGRLRSHRIKKLHGMLPTLKEMQKRLPGIYTTNVCRRCEGDTESDHHLWNCPATWTEQKEAWDRSLLGLTALNCHFGCILFVLKIILILFLLLFPTLQWPLWRS